MTSSDLRQLVDLVLSSESPASAPSLDASLRFALRTDGERVLNPIVVGRLRSNSIVPNLEARLATPTMLAHLYVIPAGECRAILFAAAGTDATLRYLAVSPFMDLLREDRTESRMWEIGVDLCFPNLFDSFGVGASLVCTWDAESEDAAATYRVFVDEARWRAVQSSERRSVIERIQRLVYDRHCLAKPAGRHASFELRTRDANGTAVRLVARERMTSTRTT